MQNRRIQIMDVHRPRRQFLFGRLGEHGIAIGIGLALLRLPGKTDHDFLIRGCPAPDRNALLLLQRRSSKRYEAGRTTLTAQARLMPPISLICEQRA